MSRLTRDGTVETVSRDQILRREREQGNIIFPCSADHEQNWQLCPADTYSCYMCDHIYYVITYSQQLVFVLIPPYIPQPTCHSFRRQAIDLGSSNSDEDPYADPEGKRR